MPDTRLVHDILFGEKKGPGFRKNNPSSPVAFIQHGNTEDGFSYEIICAYCASTVGRIPEEGEEYTYGRLHKEGHALLTPHMKLCTASGFRYRVQITKRPLGVDRLIKES